MAFTLVALFDDKARYPTVPPEFAQHIGWLTFAFALAMLAWTWTRSESVRRSILALEDPRTFAVLRIGFAIMTITNFLNLAPYWRMLFSDEGMFDLVYAQDRMGRTALRGWSPDEGFFDIWAVANFLWNKPSLFYMYGSPKFVVFHMLLLFGVCTLYGFGVASRTTGVLAWLLMSSVYNRNSLYWEGTDTVYRAFWLFMLFAKTGHAWSFDNWLRCRRLRRRGALEDPEASAEDNRGKQPIYRLIPAWPRYLFLLQLAALYCATGTVKTGDVWAKGDALYYALNMDHFYRFEGITQAVSSALATNVFRLNTWVTHWWEMCFPILIVGEVLRFGAKHRHEPWYRAQQRGWRLWLGRLALVIAYTLLYRTLYEILPYCVKMVEDTPKDTSVHLRWLHIVFGIAVPVFVVKWYVLGRWPIRLIAGGRSLGKLTRRWPWLRIPEIHIEQQSLRRWLLGRRVWLTLGFIFHGFLIAFMNIGMFPFIMLMQYAAFYTGDEYVRVLGGLSAWLRRRSRLARLAPPQHAFVPAQDPASVPLRGRKFPDLVVLLLGLVAVYLVYAKVTKEPWVGTATKWWLGTIVVTGIALRLLRPRAREVAAAREPGPALAYSAVGRAIALFAFCWHTSAVGLHLFPPFPVFNTWRSPAKSLFGSWLSGTGTAQSWEMFAPNPPRSNTFMKTVVVEADGDRWNLANNAYDYRPNPWIINDRMRKMQRRMIGKGKWYLRYWVNYHCRDWALRTGEVPEEIEIWSISTRIPSPEAVNIWQPARFKGRKDPSGATTGRPYDPRELRVKEALVQTHPCGKDGQLPEYMKERYGFEVTDEDRAAAEKESERLERQYSSRESTWDNRSDWGRGGDSPEERRARTEKLRRDRQAEQLEERIDDAQENPIENDRDEERGDEGEENS
jgi:hypothetical protein